MEKKQLVNRNRSVEDKRIVTIQMGEQGRSQMQAIVKEVMYYGQLVMREFSPEEMKLLLKFFETTTRVLSEERKKEETEKKVRKIMIE